MLADHTTREVHKMTTTNVLVQEPSVETLLIPYMIEMRLDGIPFVETQKQLDAISKRASTMRTVFQSSDADDTEFWLDGCCVNSRPTDVCVSYLFYSVGEPAATGIDRAVKLAASLPEETGTHVDQFTIKLFSRTSNKPASDQNGDNDQTGQHQTHATAPDGDMFSIEHNWRPANENVTREILGLPYEYEAIAKITNHGHNPTGERLLGITIKLLDEMNEIIKTPMR